MDVDRLSGLTLYLVVFTIVFLESGVPIGFWLPGDAMLFAAGLMAADPTHHVSLPILATGITIAAVLGVWTGYLTGRRLGRPWLERRHKKLLKRTEAFYERFGAVTLVVARFVPWARTFAPILAGAVRMPQGRFLTVAVVGAVIWGAGIPSLGYAASSVPGLEEAAWWLAPGVVVAAIGGGLIGELLRRRAARAAAEAGDDDPASQGDATASGSLRRRRAPATERRPCEAEGPEKTARHRARDNREAAQGRPPRGGAAGRWRWVVVAVVPGCWAWLRSGCAVMLPGGCDPGPGVGLGGRHRCW